MGVMGFRWIRGHWKWLIVHGRVLVIKLRVVRYMVLGEVMSDVRKSGATKCMVIGLAQVHLLLLVMMMMMLLLLLLLLPFVVVRVIVNVDFTLVMFRGFWLVQLAEEGGLWRWIVVVAGLRNPRVVLDHRSNVGGKIWVFLEYCWNGWDRMLEVVRKEVKGLGGWSARS